MQQYTIAGTVTLEPVEPEGVSPSDVLTRISAEIPFANQSGYTAQVVNTYTRAQDIPEAGIHGVPLPGGDTLRLGKASDPAGTRRALAFQVVRADPTTSGGKRSELSVAPNIEWNRVYWIGFNVLVYDWGTLAGADNALFGCQVHSGDNAAGLSPSFALYTSQLGRHFRVQARYSKSSTPSQSNSMVVRFAEYPMPFGHWVDFVFKFRHHVAGEGFLEAWMDGEQIANHQASLGDGNLGFYTGRPDYAKFGYYNWTEAAMNNVPRKVLLRSPTIVADPTGETYDLTQIRALL